MLVAATLLLCVACACAAHATGPDNRPRPKYRFTPTADPVTRVRVGAPETHAPRIHPRVFSNFLEHLGGSIYEGLWANAVYNPNFAVEGDGGPIRWMLHGGAAPAGTGPAGASVRLPAGADVVQATTLPVHRELRYRGALWVEATDGSAAVDVSLRGADGQTELDRVSLAVPPGPGRRRTFALHVPGGSVGRGASVQVAITARSGAASVTCVELFPADAVDGMDPDIVRLTRDLSNELLRWPGGNFVSGYHWRRGVGPRESRPTVPNPAWRGLETHHFGTDEFMRLCRRARTQPQICVNAGDGTPEDAAAWVQYCNGSADTPMGRLRAANGHPEPYNVRVWEIGNELYGDWQIGHTDATGNAARFVAFRKAMLAADPSIEIIATGKGDSYAGAGLDFDRAWNAAVLGAADADAHGPPQYLSVHPLVSLPGGLGRNHSYDEVHHSALAHPQWWWQTYVPEMRRMLAREVRTVELAPTEWGIIVGGPDWMLFPNHNQMSGALYAALYLHAMYRAADIVTLSNVTALLHGGGIARPRSVAIVYPMYHVQRMHSAARPSRVLPVEVTGPSYSVPRRGFLPAVQDVPWVDVVAADSPGSRWLFTVNRHPSERQALEVTLDRPARRAEVETLAADPRAGNLFEQPNHVAPTRREMEVAGRSLSLTLPPSSVVVVRLR